MHSSTTLATRNSVARTHTRQTAVEKQDSSPGDRKERIGQGLVRIGALTEEQVSQVLIQQRTETNVDRLFGEVAVELGFVDDETINSYLESGK